MLRYIRPNHVLVLLDYDDNNICSELIGTLPSHYTMHNSRFLFTHLIKQIRVSDPKLDDDDEMVMMVDILFA